MLCLQTGIVEVAQINIQLPNKTTPKKLLQAVSIK
jgi:hypothetical protein